MNTIISINNKQYQCNYCDTIMDLLSIGFDADLQLNYNEPLTVIYDNITYHCTHNSRTIYADGHMQLVLNVID